MLRKFIRLDTGPTWPQGHPGLGSGASPGRGKRTGVRGEEAGLRWAQVAPSLCVFADTRTQLRPRRVCGAPVTRAPVGTPEPSEGLRACPRVAHAASGRGPRASRPRPFLPLGQAG